MEKGGKTQLEMFEQELLLAVLGKVIVSKETAEKRDKKKEGGEIK